MTLLKPQFPECWDDRPVPNVFSITLPVFLLSSLEASALQWKHVKHITLVSNVMISKLNLQQTIKEKNGSDPSLSQTKRFPARREQLAKKYTGCS